MTAITSLPALADNTIHFIADAKSNAAAVVDPGEAAPVLQKISDEKRTLEAILITHKHADHIGGIGAILQQHPQALLVSPPDCPLPPRANTRIVAENDRVELFGGTLILSVLHTPGHTLEHIAYVGGGFLFCGDTLFPCGCGRVFEGTFAQMLHSIDKLAALPPDTLAYCGHEYTRQNIAFAEAAEPDNPHRQNYTAAAKLQAGHPTSPFAIGEERACNPFVRVREPALIAAAKLRGSDDSAESVFATLRRWKDNF